MSMKGTLHLLMVTGLLALVVSATGDEPVPGGPWADGESSADSVGPGNQGVMQSRERLRRAESARQDQVIENKRRLHDSVDRALEQRRQESREDAAELRERGRHPFGHVGF